MVVFRALSTGGDQRKQRSKMPCFLRGLQVSDLVVGIYVRLFFLFVYDALTFLFFLGGGGVVVMLSL